MRSIKAVIFDMDGVLIDSEMYYMNELKHFVHDRFKKWIPDDELLKIVGANGQTHWLVAMPYLPKEWTIIDYQREYRQYLKKNPVNYKEILFAGVSDAMYSIQNMGLRMSIASSSPGQKIKEMLEKCELGKYIDFYLSREDVTNTKPNPEIYLKSARMHGMNTDQCIVIEDSAIGIDAAVSAGMCVIAREEKRYSVNQSKAQFFFNSYLELPELIKTIMQ